MDPPLIDVELLPENEKIQDEKEEGPAFHCGLYDTEVVHKIAQALLPGLATACVDNTTGGIFKSPGSVAVDIRKEMIDYLTQRSESFVAESVILEGSPEAEVSDHPFDIISDFVDDFAISKRNFFSRVSGWLLSEKREDRVDDFVQEMEMNGFWLLERREAVAQTLLKNVDFKNTFHCDLKFKTSEELVEHMVNCGFGPLNCTNEGCTAMFSAKHLENHDSVCPFKMIPCEQKCPDILMRREMDRHCITVCPMKLVNCPFYAVGCQSTVPKCMIQQHNSDDLHSHVLCILKSNYYKEAPVEALKQRANQIVQVSSGELGDARDVRSLHLKIKNLDAKLGPLEIKVAEVISEESSEAADNTIGEPTEATTIKNGEPTETKNYSSKEPTEAANNKNGEPTETRNIKKGEPTEAANNTNRELIEAAIESGEPAEVASINIGKSTEAANTKNGEPVKIGEAATGINKEPIKAANGRDGEPVEDIKQKNEEENEYPVKAATQREQNEDANGKAGEPVEGVKGEPTEVGNDKSGEFTGTAHGKDGESMENENDKSAEDTKSTNGEATKAMDINNSQPTEDANNTDTEATEPRSNTKANKIKIDEQCVGGAVANASKEAQGVVQS
ncbi:hypothetical protein K2173_024256 [Erythroxylum novogranatense]|uniref:TRAF-type domain-containing protein n=1 Tax=Erythroxylum novogranatense TaxID=1862640 RepID=A0AAV8UCI0_9ROSI|nr:hypothetical protein K2173_024256 [Erythroxylum novogranatense]